MKKTVVIIIMGIVIVWLFIDLRKTRNKYELRHNTSSTFENVIDAISSATTTVSVVGSDNPKLKNPVSKEDTLDFDQVEDMVRYAVKLAGGLEKIVKPGDMVLIKPNIVEPEPSGCGEITDVRVVKALIKIVDEIDHGNIEIVIGEGSPRPTEYEMKFQQTYFEPVWKEIWDVPGYTALLNDPYLEGIKLRFSNLNGSPPEDPWQDIVKVQMPNALSVLQKNEYYIHKDVLNADVFISVPVMKSHITGITAGLKNVIGALPSTRYGYNKQKGVPQDNFQTKLIHYDSPQDWVDKTIVDAARLCQIKFSVIDAINCLETNKIALWEKGVPSNLVRMNCVLAGTDVVAVDHVSARIMGLNPDDIEHLTLAEKVGMGNNQAYEIEIVGSELEKIVRPFKKDRSIWGQYGQSNRDWILHGPHSIEGIDDPIHHPFIENEARVVPKPGKDGWSKAVYFNHDRLDLYEHYEDPGKSVCYAFVYFYSLKTQEAELWLGSDESMKIYLNGKSVYEFDGLRSFVDEQFVNDKVKIIINEGVNHLLVKTLHRYGYSQFCLNICEPDPDPSLDGDRVWGLKFDTNPNRIERLKMYNE